DGQRAGGDLELEAGVDRGGVDRAQPGRNHGAEVADDAVADRGVGQVELGVGVEHLDAAVEAGAVAVLDRGGVEHQQAVGRGLQQLVAADGGVVDLELDGAERGAVADHLERAGVGDRAVAGGAADVVDGQRAGGDLELEAGVDRGGVDRAQPGRNNGAEVADDAVAYLGGGPG